MKTFRSISIFIFTILVCQSLWTQDKPDALVLYRDGKFSEAVVVCLEELKENSKNMDSYSVLCWSLMAQGKYEEALTYTKQGMTVSRYDRRMIFTAGEALYNLGRNREALKYFEEYAVYLPTAAKIKDIYYFMGEIYIRLGEFQNADIAFSTALHYESTNGHWWARLGYAREMAEDYKWALDAYNKALQISPRLTEATLGKQRVSKFVE